MKDKLIFIGLIIFIILLSCNNKVNSPILTEKLSAQVYFSPSLSSEIISEGSLSKKNNPIGDWKITIDDDIFNLKWKEFNTSKILLSIPFNFSFQKNTKDGVYYFKDRNDKIIIYFDSLANNEQLRSGNKNTVLNELGGVSELCFENTDCIIDEYMGNLIMYSNNKSAAVFTFKEEYNGVSLYKLGYITTTTRYKLFVEFESDNWDEIELNKIKFSYLINSIQFEKEELVPSIVNFLNIVPLAFPDRKSQ